jgi:signal transduction histidine kinase
MDTSEKIQKKLYKNRLSGASFLAILIGSLAMGALVGFTLSEVIPLWVFGLVMLGWLLWCALKLIQGLLNSLKLAELALQNLAEGKPASRLEMNTYTLLPALYTQINRLVENDQNLRRMRGQLQGQVEAAIQEERNRLARDLHDSIKQQIFSISVSAATAQARWERDPSGAQAALADVRTSAHEAMVEMKALLQQLKPAPLEQVGLVQALRDQCEALQYRTGAIVTTEIGELPSDDRLPPGAQENIFRIAQEALTNIARHARAEHVKLSLRQEADAQNIVLEIADDGQGFDTSAATPGMGLGNIRQRTYSFDGQIEINSRSGKGTLVRVSLPFDRQLEIQPDPLVEARHNKIQQTAQGWMVIEGITISAWLFAASVFLKNLLTIPRDWVLLGVLVAGTLAVGALLFYSTRKIREMILQAQAETGSHSPLSLNLRYWRQTAFSLQAFMALWFVPLGIFSFKDWEHVSLAGVVGGTIFVAITIYYGVRANFTLHNYHQELSPSKLEQEISRGWRQTNAGWFATILLIAQSAFFISRDFALLPRTIDHWMTMFFILAALLTFANQLYWTAYLWRHQKKLT